MFHRVDTISGISALALHAGIAIALVALPPRESTPPTTIEVEVVTPKPPEPPQITPPKPPEPEPEKKVVPKIKAVAPPDPTPKPNQEPPKDPPKEPPKPVFGLDPTEMSNDGEGISAPVGNSTMGDPNKNKNKNTGPVKPLGAGTAGAPVKESYSPIKDVFLKSAPEIDSESCARMVAYPTEAEQMGLEGEVKLKVFLEDTGKVHDIQPLTHLGHGLEQAAMFALKHKCKFKPAIGTDGKPAAYVIQTYVWIFELPR